MEHACFKHIRRVTSLLFWFQCIISVFLTIACLPTIMLISGEIHFVENSKRRKHGGKFRRIKYCIKYIKSYLSHDQNCIQSADQIPVE